MNKPIKIATEYIRLCDLLKFAGIAMSGGQAKEMILSGDVSVNGEVCLLKGRKLRHGDTVTFDGDTYEVVVT